VKGTRETIIGDKPIDNRIPDDIPSPFSAKCFERCDESQRFNNGDCTRTITRIVALRTTPLCRREEDIDVVRLDNSQLGRDSLQEESSEYHPRPFPP